VTVRRTHRWTNGRTDILRRHSPRYAYASRSKNVTITIKRHESRQELFHCASLRAYRLGYRYLFSKAAKRLWLATWFLKKLKRAGVAREDLVYFYQAVVRPVLEYACPAWHTSITKDIQRRAILVIVGNIPYEEACCMLNLSPLADRRRRLCSTLFNYFKHIASWESHVLHYPRLRFGHILVPFESFGAVSYSPSIVTMAVSLTVYEIFSVMESIA